MHTDIVDLRQFYCTRLGALAQRSITMGAGVGVDGAAGGAVDGTGLRRSLSRPLPADAERTLAFMPAAQGAVNWPPQEASATALVFDEELPLPDAALDRVLMVHALEYAENPRETLMEAWRVLAPGGRLVIVVPNRRASGRGSSTRPSVRVRPILAISSPACCTRPTSPPAPSLRRFCFRRPSTRPSSAVAHHGAAEPPLLAVPEGGVVIVEAQKRLYQGLPVAERASRRVFVPVLAPQGASRAMRDRLC